MLEKGYQVFTNVVPSRLCQDVIADIETHTEQGRYAVAPGSGLVEMYHYQSMWNIRQLPDIYGIFSGIFGDSDLWVSIDRCCRKDPLPQDKEWPGFLHWDINPNQRPRPLVFQGLVALADTDESMGGFWCVPDLYKNLDEFIASLPSKKILNPNLEPYKGRAFYHGTRRNQYLENWPIERVPMRAGDLLVWDSFLPHGNGPNYSDRVRYAQYVTMEKVGDERMRQERILCFEANEPPSGFAFPGDDRRIEQGKPAAKLTELGYKLLRGVNNLRTLCRRCHVLRADFRHRGMIANALRDGIIPFNWRELVWE